MISSFLARLKHCYVNDEGATVVEYGLIAGGIALAIVVAMFAFADDLQSVLNVLGSSLSSISVDVETGS